MATYKKNRHYRGAEGKQSRSSAKQIERGKLAAHLQECPAELKHGARGELEKSPSPPPAPRRGRPHAAQPERGVPSAAD